MKQVLGLILTLCLFTACAPATVAPFNFSDGTRFFKMSVDGTAIPASDDAFPFRTDGLEATVRLGRQFIRMDVRNTSTVPLYLIWDDSSISLPDGRVSGIGLEQTTNVVVRQPGTPTILPPGSRIVTNLYPVGNRGYQTLSGIQADPMFIFPIRATTTLRLNLALKLGTKRSALNLEFLAQPER
jgi:hypothetical protein